jgi:hypothetical protein
MVSLRQRISFHEAGHTTAALVYNIPIITVSIDADVPHLHRGHYRAPANIGLERLVTMCLAGPAAERYFVGPITDGSDATDYRMALTTSIGEIGGRACAGAAAAIDVMALSPGGISSVSRALIAYG